MSPMQSKDPFVTAKRAADIKAFRRSLALMETAYGLKLSADTDGSGDILITDQTRTLPQGYYYDARIEADGTLDFAEYVLEDETGATKQ